MARRARRRGRERAELIVVERVRAADVEIDRVKQRAQLAAPAELGEQQREILLVAEDAHAVPGGGRAGAVGDSLGHVQAPGGVAAVARATHRRDVEWIHDHDLPAATSMG
jgi:hypothetical protein